MENKKILFISLAVAFSLFLIIFWLFFIVISSRRPTYTFSISSSGEDCTKREYLLYYEKNNVKYYSACYDKVYISEEKFIFQNIKDIKEYIDSQQLLSILQEFDMYKWKYSEGVQTDYYVFGTALDSSFIITRCSTESEDTYYFHRGEDVYLCQYFLDYSIKH